MEKWGNLSTSRLAKKINEQNLERDFSENFGIPIDGSRGMRDHAYATLENQGDVFIWSSSPYVTSSYNGGYYIRLMNNWVNMTHAIRRGFGTTVRCFSDDYLFTSPYMTIHPNGWTGAMILVEGGNVKSLWTPSRANSHFEWWYSNAGLTTSVTTWSAAPANLYAKWSCDTGYVASGNQCLLW
jgi:hypothetical protein